VEIDRWTGPGVPINERKGYLCEPYEISDEFHYLLFCHYFKEYRKHFIKQYYYKNANTIKFSKLLNIKN
jgi:hypothetical protein